MSLLSRELLELISEWSEILGAVFGILAATSVVVYVLVNKPLRKIEAHDNEVLRETISAQQEHTAALQLEALSLQKQLIAQGSRVALLYGDKRERLIEDLKPYSKQKAEVRYCDTSFNEYFVDNDTMGLAMQLRSALAKAGWSVSPLVREHSNGTGIGISMNPKAPQPTVGAANQLLTTLLNVPLVVIGSKVFLAESRRAPQPETIQDGKEWKWEPVTEDTIVVTVYAHP